MEYVVVFAVLVIVLVVPVMIGARIVKARNTGFGAALLAVIILALISAGIDRAIANDIVALLLSTAAGALVLSMILGTSFLRGLAVSVFAAILQLVVMLLFAGAILGSSTFASV
jgi:hypothetical protein